MIGRNVDMFSVGIIDPVKVTRIALENAVSVASMILTTEVLVTDLPEKKNLQCQAGCQVAWAEWNTKQLEVTIYNFQLSSKYIF